MKRSQPILITAFLALIISCVSAQPGKELPPVPDPEGLKGSILVYGGVKPTEEIRKQFLRSAGGQGAFLLVLSAGPTPSPDEELAAWGRLAPAKIRRASLSEVADSGARALAGIIDQASGVWLEHVDLKLMAARMHALKVAAPLRRLLLRGGILGSCNSTGALLGAESEGVAGLDLWPQVIIACGAEEASVGALLITLKRFPGRVGISLPLDGGIQYHLRRLRAIGTSEPSILTMSSSIHGLSVMQLRKGRVADLNRLSLAAIARTKPPFPPTKMRVGGSAKGTLIAVGGGSLPEVILHRFITAAGGMGAPIVVIPTAVPDPVPTKPAMVMLLKRLGATQVSVLHARTPHEAARASFRLPLRKARGVWFGGGRQWRLVDAYLGGEAQRILQKLLAEGGVIGGSSAGATIQGEYLVRGHPLGNQVMMAEGYERGLGFLRGIAIDQHFSQRNRFKDLEKVKGRYPQLLCLGIDESTAVVVQGTTMEVMGKHQVAVYDRPLRHVMKGGRYTSLRSGDHYNLRTLKRID